jgi:hypothetical protein
MIRFGPISVAFFLFLTKLTGRGRSNERSDSQSRLTGGQGLRAASVLPAGSFTVLFESAGLSKKEGAQ